jgi:REP element-mobilizing transposase RayT
MHKSRSHTRCDAGTPLAYFLSFTTYGTWLHGDERGSVDPAHNIPGTPTMPPDPRRQAFDRRLAKHPPIMLDGPRRQVITRTIIEVAEHRCWTVHALNVRTNHVHIVISASEPPERVLNSMKSWATRRMVETGVLPPGTKAWTRHGSTRYLWTATSLREACEYVCERQGADLDEAP